MKKTKTTFLCVCVCVYVCVYIYIHTHTHDIKCVQLYIKMFKATTRLKKSCL